MDHILHLGSPAERHLHNEPFSVSEIILEIGESDEKSEDTDDEFQDEGIVCGSKRRKESYSHSEIGDEDSEREQRSRKQCLSPALMPAQYRRKQKQHDSERARIDAIGDRRREHDAEECQSLFEVLLDRLDASGSCSILAGCSGYLSQLARKIVYDVRIAVDIIAVSSAIDDKERYADPVIGQVMLLKIAVHLHQVRLIEEDFFLDDIEFLGDLGILEILLHLRTMRAPVPIEQDIFLGEIHTKHPYHEHKYSQYILHHGL